MSGGKLSLQRSVLTVWMCAEQEQRSGSCSGELWQLFMLPAPFIPVAFTNGLLWLGVEFSFPSDLENQHKLVYSELLPSLLSCLSSTTCQSWTLFHICMVSFACLQCSAVLLVFHWAWRLWGNSSAAHCFYFCSLHLLSTVWKKGQLWLLAAVFLNTSVAILRV